MIQDCLIRGVHSAWGLRAVWVECVSAVNRGITIHDTDPAAAMALADAMSAAAAASAVLDDGEKFSIRYDYPGTIKGLLVEVTADAAIRALPMAPHPMELGKAELTELYGDNDGFVAVTRSNSAGKILNSGQTRAPLAAPGDDLAFYFSVSDQVETEIRTWADWRPDPLAPLSRMSALMLQALPGCDLEAFGRLREALHSADAAQCRNEQDFSADPIGSLTKVLEKLADLSGLSDFDPRQCVFTTGAQPRWQCRCSRETMHRAMQVLGKEDLARLFEEREHPEIKCQFCRNSYRFRKSDFFED